MRNGGRRITTKIHYFFLWKEGCSPSNIFERLTSVFEAQALKRSTVYEWVTKFKDGRTPLEDNLRPGRPLSSFTPENVVKVKACIMEDRRITIREITETLDLNAFNFH